MTEVRCKHCNKGFTNGSRVTCSDCSGSFHYKCVNMTREDLSFLDSEGRVWRCDKCGQDRRKSRMCESRASHSEQILTNIMQEISGIRHEMQREYQGIMSSMNSYSSKVEEYSCKVDSLTDKINDVTDKVRDLKETKSQVLKHLDQLENKVSCLEQTCKDGDVEIQGVPAKANEDLYQLVKKLGTTVGYPVNDEMISVCYRVQTRRKGANPPVIVVRFVRVSEKERFLRKCREAESLTTRHIGIVDGSSQRIYINESLTLLNRKLLSCCKEIKKAKGYKFLWIRNGKIFLRKSENESTIQIRCRDDLANL